MGIYWVGQVPGSNRPPQQRARRAWHEVLIRPRSHARAGGEPPALAHVPAKACPGLDPGWIPVRRQEHAPLDNSRACPDSEGTGHALETLIVEDGRPAGAQTLSSSLSFTTRSCGSRRLLIRYCTSPPPSGSCLTTLYSPSAADLWGKPRHRRTVCPDRNRCVISAPFVGASPGTCEAANHCGAVID